MAFEIEFDPDAVKDLKKLDRPIQQRLVRFLKTRVAKLENPREIGEALSGAKLESYWKYRVGDWRIISTFRIGASLFASCGLATAGKCIEPTEEEHQVWETAPFFSGNRAAYNFR